jgi:hypothetical protein
VQARLVACACCAQPVLGGVATYVIAQAEVRARLEVELDRAVVQLAGERASARGSGARGRLSLSVCERMSERESERASWRETGGVWRRARATCWKSGCVEWKARGKKAAAASPQPLPTASIPPNARSTSSASCEPSHTSARRTAQVTRHTPQATHREPHTASHTPQATHRRRVRRFGMAARTQ